MEKRKKSQNAAGRHGASFWQEEKQNFGLKMMEKMGWQEGKGLGKSESGQSQFVRAVKKQDTLGIGASSSRDDVWFAAQGVYNDLLKRLGQAAKDGTLTDGSMKADEEVAAEQKESAGTSLKKFMTRKNLYGKFRKAKDSSNYSQTDMSAILGRKTDDKKSAPESQPAAESDSTIVTVTSSVSTKDYFASKLKSGKKPSKFQAASGGGFSLDDQANFSDRMMDISHSGKGGLGLGNGSQRQQSADSELRHNRKAKAELTKEAEAEETSTMDEPSSTVCPSEAPTAKAKRKRATGDESADSTICSASEAPTTKTKRKHKQSPPEVVEEPSDEQVQPRKKRKSKE